MAALPLPPSGSQGSRVSPGEAPSWLYASSPLFLLPRPCHDADTSRNGFWTKLPLNPVSIWIHQCQRTQTFCQTQLDFSPVCFPLFQVGIFQASGHFDGTPAGHFNYTVHAWRHIIMRQALEKRQEMKSHYTWDIRYILICHYSWPGNQIYGWLNEALIQMEVSARCCSSSHLTILS